MALHQVLSTYSFKIIKPAKNPYCHSYRKMNRLVLDLTELKFNWLMKKNQIVVLFSKDCGFFCPLGLFQYQFSHYILCPLTLCELHYDKVNLGKGSSLLKFFSASVHTFNDTQRTIHTFSLRFFFLFDPQKIFKNNNKIFLIYYNGTSWTVIKHISVTVS